MPHPLRLTDCPLYFYSDEHRDKIGRAHMELRNELRAEAPAAYWAYYYARILARSGAELLAIERPEEFAPAFWPGPETADKHRAGGHCGDLTCATCYTRGGWRREF